MENIDFNEFGCHNPNSSVGTVAGEYTLHSIRAREEKLKHQSFWRENQIDVLVSFLKSVGSPVGDEML